MYQIPPSQELRQGDVIDFFSYPVLRRLPQENELLNIVVKEQRIVLVSHSCDLIHESTNKRPGFLFTPLVPVINFLKKNPENYKIFSRNEIDPKKPNFIHLFRYETAPSIKKEQMIDLSTIQCAPCSFLGLCREKKLLELTEHSRDLLQKKLMFHFGINR